MEEFLLIIVVSATVGLIVCVPTALALWAVLGEAHFLFRLAGMLLCIGIVGAFFARSPTPMHLAEKCGFAATLLFFCFSIWAFGYWLSRLVVACILFSMLWIVFRHAGEYFFDPQSYAAAAIAVPFGASMVLAFRLLGFRFIRLTGKVSDADIEIGTGLNFDAWLAELRQADGESMSRSEIVSFLRERGVPFSYQRILTDAYEMSIGRRILGVAVDGTPQTVVAHSQIGRARVERNDVASSRWSLTQLMVLSVVAAGLFTLARAMALQVPDLEQLSLLTMGALCCALIAVPVLAAELSVDRHSLNRAIYLMVASIVSAAVPIAIGMFGIWFTCTFGSILCLTAWLVASVTLVRHHGYRIVLVGRPSVAT